MRIGVGLSIPELATRGGKFSPASLFSGGVQGAWYAPDDFSTLFQDSAGTTPVTAVEQPVGLMRDKSGNNNHASQATAASRPVLRARYNLLTYSEQFDNAAWTKTSVTVSANDATAPDGTTTADKITANNLATLASVYQNYGSEAADKLNSVTASFYVKSNGFRWVYVLKRSAAYGISYFDIIDGVLGTSTDQTAAITNVGNGWYRISITDTLWPLGTPQLTLGICDANGSTVVTGNGTSGIYAWGAQLVYGSSAGTYQRIAAATDYATAGFLPYLAFDGTDDSFGTGSINFTATDKMFACVGVTKLSDAADAMLAELSSSYTANTGSFYITAPEIAPGAKYAIAGRGAGAFTSDQLAKATSTAYNAPSTVVLTGIFNIPGDSNNLRLNGTSIATATGDQGTGNYGNYPLFIGRRNNATVPFNGRIYQMVVCGKTLSASELASTEAYVNSKTGAY